MRVVWSLFIVAGSIFFVSSCEKKGCTDSLALNYSSEAEKDDGSCVYAQNIKIEGIEFNNFDLIGWDVGSSPDTKIYILQENTTTSQFDTLYTSDIKIDNGVAVDKVLIWSNPILFPNGTNTNVIVKLVDDDIGQDQDIAVFTFDLSESSPDTVSPHFMIKTNQQGTNCNVRVRWY